MIGVYKVAWLPLGGVACKLRAESALPNWSAMHHFRRWDKPRFLLSVPLPS
jgi:hypothetical protein